MKFFLILSTTLLMACSSENGDTPSIDASSEVPGENETTPEVQDELVGTWNMDSSAFLDGSADESFTPPLIETKWYFHEGGKYEVKNNISMSGSYVKNGNSLAVTIMGMTTDYEILQFENGHLVIESFLYKGSDTKTQACLTKISD